MLREILLFALIIYGLYKLGLFRSLVAPFRNDGEHARRPRGGNVNVDSAPPEKKSEFKGGDYIDYEEVK